MKATQHEVWENTSEKDPVAFRRALGAFTTGVTVVCARAADGQVRAFTANSFTSVSLNPALVLVCLGKNSASLDSFSAADLFSISVLQASQRETSGAFASRDPQVKVAAIEQLRGEEIPYVGESLATFICSRHQVIEAGDHIILLGRVTRFLINEGQPLAYFRGGYVGIGADVRELEQLRASMMVGGVLAQEDGVLLIRKHGASRWEIPMVSLSCGNRHDKALHQLFESMGIVIDMAAPYSLFQESKEVDTTLIFSVDCSVPVKEQTLTDGTELRFFKSGAPELADVGGEMKTGVLRRYLAEMHSGLFGVYFDSHDGGSVVPIQGKPVSWSTWYQPVSTGTDADRIAPQAQ